MKRIVPLVVENDEAHWVVAALMDEAGLSIRDNYAWLPVPPDEQLAEDVKEAARACNVLASEIRETLDPTASAMDTAVEEDAAEWEATAARLQKAFYLDKEES